MGIAFHQKLREGFLDVAKDFPNRCVVMDAEQDIETIHNHMMEIIKHKFGLDRKGGCRVPV